RQSSLSVRAARAARDVRCPWPRGYLSASPGASRRARVSRPYQARWTNAACGSSSLNFHDFRLYGDCCSRPSFRPRMYRRERGRDQSRPPGGKPWRGFIFQGGHSSLPPGPPHPPPITVLSPPPPPPPLPKHPPPPPPP